MSKGVLFDVDGTLSDSFLLGYNSTLIVLQNNALPTISQETYHQGTKYTTTTRMAWHATGDPNDPIGVRLGREFDDEYIKQVSLNTTPFYSGIGNMLRLFHSNGNGVKYAAVSNASGGYVRSVLKVNGAEDLFDITIGADEVTRGKPDPEGILRCIQHMGIDASNCMFVGDSPTDGQAASAAGMKSIGVTWGSYSEDKIKESFTHIARSVQELEEMLVHYVCL